MPPVEELQAAAKRLLADEDEARRVDVVVGYGRGTLPLRSTPLFVRNAEDAGKLVFDATCGANLVRYLRKVSGRQSGPGGAGRERPGRAAVVVKGCDVRSLVESLKEQQFDRERIAVITVPCEGVMDLDAVIRHLGAPELLDAEIDGSEIRVRTREGERVLPLEEFLVARCRSCDAREPVIPDGVQAERVGEIGTGGGRSTPEERAAALRAFEQKSPEERWAHFAEEASKCILCYACRSACPMCYCPECFVECTQPAWLGREHNLSNQQVYHLMRALHLAGRCVGCGDCVRACPMGVDLALLGEKLRETVKELYNVEPGADPEEEQALTSYSLDDWQEFIM